MSIIKEKVIGMIEKEIRNGLLIDPEDAYWAGTAKQIANSIGNCILSEYALYDWAVLGNIKEVTHCILREVTEDVLLADGFKDTKEALEELRKYYPDLDYNSPVTVIRW